MPHVCEPHKTQDATLFICVRLHSARFCFDSARDVKSQNAYARNELKSHFTMLRSCSLTCGSSIPLDRQQSAKSLQRACSSSLDSLPSPASLKRLPSGPVQAPTPVTLSFTSDQIPAPRVSQITNEDLQRGFVCRMAVTMSPTKPRTAQDFKANFGAAVRYSCCGQVFLSGWSAVCSCWCNGDKSQTAMLLLQDTER